MPRIIDRLTSAPGVMMHGNVLMNSLYGVTAIAMLSLSDWRRMDFKKVRPAISARSWMTIMYKKYANAKDWGWLEKKIDKEKQNGLGEIKREKAA